MGILEPRGFRRDQAGYVTAFLRETAGLVVTLPLTPGFEIELLTHAPDQTTGAATLADATGTSLPFGKLDAVAFSELIRDLEALRPT